MNSPLLRFLKRYLIFTLLGALMSYVTFGPVNLQKKKNSKITIGSFLASSFVFNITMKQE